MLPPVSPSASNSGLAQLIQASGIDAVLTLSSAQTRPEQNDLWVPIHSAVVLQTNSACNPHLLASALQQTLRGTLTTATIGIYFNTTGDGIYALTGPRPLFFALSSTPAQGNLTFFADHRTLLAELLHNHATGPPEKTSTPAIVIAVFNHSSQHAPYLRLISLIDGTNNQPSHSRNTAHITPDGGDDGHLHSYLLLRQRRLALGRVRQRPVRTHCRSHHPFESSPDCHLCLENSVTSSLTLLDAKTPSHSRDASQAVLQKCILSRKRVVT